MLEGIAKIVRVVPGEFYVLGNCVRNPVLGDFSIDLAVLVSYLMPY